MRKTEITDPIFYFQRNDLVMPAVAIPNDRMGWIGKMTNVKRHINKGYKRVIFDNLYAHTMRVTKWAMVLPYISEHDKKEITNMAMIHDVGEVGLKHDTTTADKLTDFKAEMKQDTYEEIIAEKLLSPDDYILWHRYHAAKPFFNGLTHNNHIDPNAILTKIVDVAENETFFHFNFLLLRDEYGIKAYDMFPPRTFSITFPRLARYRMYLESIQLPGEHTKVIEELFAEIEAYGKIAGQKIE